MALGTRRDAALVSGLAAVLAFLMWGCQGRRPVRIRAPEISAVVRGAGGDEPFSLPASDTQRVLAEQIERTGLFRVEDEAQARAEVEGAVQLDAITREATAALTIRIQSPGAALGSDESLPLSASVAATAALAGREDSRAGAGRILGRLWTDAARTLADQEKLRRASPDRARAFLVRGAAAEGADPNVLVFAARLAGVRRDRQAVRPLCRLLGHPRPEVRDAVLGALGEVGDRAAVRPIVDGVDDDDPMELVRVLDVLARLGGPEAAAYLELIAAGHDNAEVRRIAASARGRLAQAGR